MILVVHDIDHLKARAPVEIICENCRSVFVRPKSAVKRAIKNSRGCRFCSKACFKSFIASPPAAISCKECSREFVSAEPARQLFCCRACAGSHNNKLRPRHLVPNSRGGHRSTRNICQDCGIFRKGPRKSTMCRKCKDMTDVTIFGRRLKSSFAARNARHRYQGIRHHAHRVAKMHNISKICAHPSCAYSRKVELAHIKAISEFDNDTPLYIINAPTNLAYLCPTHHAELDDGVIVLS